MTEFSKDQLFIVTGASSGIGEGTALLLNELGASVIGIGRNIERLEQMKSKSRHPENMHIEVKELCENIEELPNYIKSLKEKYGKFQGLVYCAGILDIKPLQLIELEEIKKLFDICYFAPIFMAKGFGDRRNNNGKGASIVTVSSLATKLSERGMTAYSGAKAALTTSMKCIARELASAGIRVNTVSPSDIDTPMGSHQEILAYREIRKDKYPFGFGQIDDVTNMIIYLLSDKAKWITAQDYIIDCGYM